MRTPPAMVGSLFSMPVANMNPCIPESLHGREQFPYSPLVPWFSLLGSPDHETMPTPILERKLIFNHAIAWPPACAKLLIFHIVRVFGPQRCLAPCFRRPRHKEL